MIWLMRMAAFRGARLNPAWLTWRHITQVKRAANFRMRYWPDVNLEAAVPSGFWACQWDPRARRVHEVPQRWWVYFLLLANEGVLRGETVRANILSFQSSQTRRVCRSTLAAEAAHLAEAVKAGDWLAALLHEALHEDLDLQEWEKVVEADLGHTSQMLGRSTNICRRTHRPLEARNELLCQSVVSLSQTSVRSADLV